MGRHYRVMKKILALLLTLAFTFAFSEEPPRRKCPSMKSYPECLETVTYRACSANLMYLEDEFVGCDIQAGDLSYYLNSDSITEIGCMNYCEWLYRRVQYPYVRWDKIPAPLPE